MAKSNKLVIDLQAFSDEAIRLAERGVSETAMLLDTEASTRAPVDDGNLKASIQSEIGGLEATVNVGAFYGVYVEYGTGIYAKGPGGSRAKKLPWSYKRADGKWITTFGNVAQPFWFPSLDIASKYFRNYFN